MIHDVKPTTPSGDRHPAFRHPNDDVERHRFEQALREAGGHTRAARSVPRPTLVKPPPVRTPRPEPEPFVWWLARSAAAIYRRLTR